ncbi:hypothetical protein F4604DRAFT_603178 [Suillus subluteus]|nr:hypothetical protein F4604DRAFT_603178 [Suillus subluteus]
MSEGVFNGGLWAIFTWLLSSDRCLYCSWHIANVIRDEGDRRSGTGQKGITGNEPAKSVFANMLYFALFVAKPALCKSLDLALDLKSEFLNNNHNLININDIDRMPGRCFAVNSKRRL